MGEIVDKPSASSSSPDSEASSEACLFLFPPLCGDARGLLPIPIVAFEGSAAGAAGGGDEDAAAGGGNVGATRAFFARDFAKMLFAMLLKWRLCCWLSKVNEPSSSIVSCFTPVSSYDSKRSTPSW